MHGRGAFSSCYIFFVLPSSEIRWLRRGAIGAALLLAFFVLAAVPSRHALVEIWPGRVMELVLPDGEIRLEPANARLDEQAVLARTYPQALLALEFHDGRREHGFLVYEDAETGIWYVQTNAGLEALDPRALRRYYAPNDLPVAARLGLMRERLAERRSRPVLLLMDASAADIESVASAEGDDL